MGKKKKEHMDYKNFFNQMNHEMAEEHGIVNNEGRKKNKKLGNWAKLKKKKK